MKSQNVTKHFETSEDGLDGPRNDQLHYEIANLNEFPGWSKSQEYLQGLILKHKCRRIGDVGGGRVPRIGIEFIRQHKLDYSMVDISAEELAFASSEYHKIQLDVCCDDRKFETSDVPRNLDIVFSHMLLEHVHDPVQAHRNFFKMLSPGGISVHMFPSRNNFPLFINSLIPEWLSRKILQIVQPSRIGNTLEEKFPAFYNMCGKPTQRHFQAFRDIGFEIVGQTSYVGHEYYRSIKLFDLVENYLRKIVVRMKLPMFSAHLLILKKPDAFGG